MLLKTRGSVRRPIPGSRWRGAFPAIFSLAVLLSGRTSIFAFDPATVAWSTLGREQGFSGDSISSIVQDSRGLVWMGAGNGLYRYDGQSFAAFMEKLPGQVPAERHDIYKMMVVGFSNPLVAGFYVLGLALLCLHLSHGASSMFQSLGWKNQAYRPCLDRAARGVAVLIFLGYSSIPLAILCGYGKEALK